MTDEHGDEQQEDVLARVETWYKAFAQSAAFSRLTDSEQRKAGAVTEFFAHHAHEILGLAPDEWDSGAVVECCTEILPRKVTAELPFFEAVAPVLSAFFHFLDEQALLPNGHKLAKTVAPLADEIVAAARDSGSWGHAKQFAMAAHEAGVDLSDQAAMNAFMLQYNLQMTRSNAPFRTRSFPPFPSLPAEKRKARPSVGPYEPCPCGSGRKYKFCCKQKF